ITQALPDRTAIAPAKPQALYQGTHKDPEPRDAHFQHWLRSPIQDPYALPDTRKRKINNDPSGHDFHGSIDSTLLLPVLKDGAADLPQKVRQWFYDPLSFYARKHS